jgi:hypothetical protein
MGIGNEGFPEGSTPEEQQRIRQAALDLLHKDRDFDDSKFTPPGALNTVPEHMRAVMEAAPGTEPEVDPKVAEYDAELEAARIKEVIRTGTPEEKAEAERLLADLEFQAFDKEFGDTLDRLGEAGWVFGGGGSPDGHTIGLGFSLPEHLAARRETVFLELPIRDEEGNLYPGYELGFDEDSGDPGMGYEGPFDDRFKQVVDAMVKVAQPPETEQE